MSKQGYIRHIAVLLVVLYGLVGGHRCCCAVAHASGDSVVADGSCCTHSNQESGDDDSTDCVLLVPLDHQHSCEDGLSVMLTHRGIGCDLTDYELDSLHISVGVVLCTDFISRSAETLCVVPAIGVRLNILFEIFLI